MIDPKRGLALYVRVEGLKQKAARPAVCARRRPVSTPSAPITPAPLLPDLFELEFTLKKERRPPGRSAGRTGKGSAGHFPTWTLFKMILANEFAARGDSARAVELCREVVKANPRFAAALVLLGDMARRRRPDGEAVGFYRQALGELEPQNTRLQEILTELSLPAGAGGSNIPASRASGASGSDAERLDGMEEKARALVADNRLDRGPLTPGGCPAQRAAPRRGPGCNWGPLRRAAANSAAALGHFQEAVRLDGRHALAHFNLGIVHYTLFQKDGDRRRLQAALACFDRALSLDPDLARLRRPRCRVHGVEEGPGRERFQARLIELRPGAVNAHFNVAYALVNSGEERGVGIALRFRKSYYTKLCPRERGELDALIAEITF